jgi:hypothetical protein
MKTKIIPIILVTGYALLVTVSVASAAIVPCTGTDCTVCSLFVGTSNLINFLLKDIAFPLGVVAILYGGFMIMTAGGSEEQVKKGKTALQYAVIGIIVAFAAWLIIDTILKALLAGGVSGIKGWGPWNSIPIGC